MNESVTSARIERLAQAALIADELVERAELRAAQLQAPLTDLSELRARRAQAQTELDKARDVEAKKLNLVLAQRAHDDATRDLEAHRAIVLKLREQFADAQRRLPALENALGIKIRTWANTKSALALARAAQENL